MCGVVGIFVSKYVSIVLCWLNLIFFLFLGVWTIHRHENWQTHWFLMQVFYIFLLYISLPQQDVSSATTNSI